jgi:hypothetical protein
VSLPDTRPDSRSAAASFPYVDRLVLAIAGIGVALAALGLAASWASYSTPWPSLVCWLVTAAAMPVVLRRVAREGALTDRTLIGLTAVVYGVDVVLPMTVAAPDRLGSGTWNWGAGAILLFGCAAYRRARDVIAVAVGHTVIGVGFAVAGGIRDATAVVVMVNSCLVPPVAAAQYLGLYADGLRARQQAAALRRRTMAARANDQAQRQSILHQVEACRGRILELLDSVGDDAPVPLRSRDRAEARELSAALRRELDESRSRGWLLAPATGVRGAPRNGGSATGASGTGSSGASGEGREGAPLVDVLGWPSLRDDDARARVAGLVDLLGRHHGTHRIAVTVSPAAAPHPVPVPIPVPIPGPGTGPGTGRLATVLAPGPTSVEVTVVASGSAEAGVLADPAVAAGVAGLGGSASAWQDADGEGVVVEAILSCVPDYTPRFAGSVVLSRHRVTH